MAEPTTYIVLRQSDIPADRALNRDVWEEVGQARSSSAEAAIRNVVGSLPERQDGAYVAVPNRSWRPLTVTATTQTIVTLNPTPETT